MLNFRKPLWPAPVFSPTVWLGTFLAALIVSLPAPALAAPAVTWNPDYLSLAVVPGTSETAPVTFTANKDLSNVQISIVPELQPFVTVSPTSFGFLADGQTRTVDVTITVPSGTQSGNVDGTLHVTAEGGGGNATLARPLSIDLAIQLADSATLTVRTFEDDEPASPGSAGTIIRIDGEEVGATGEDGTLTLQVAPGLRDVVAFIPNDIGARASIELESGISKTLDLIMKSTWLPLLEDYELVIVEAQNGILPQDFSSLTLVFERPSGDAIALDGINGISVTGIAPGSASNESGGGIPITSPVRLDGFFTLSPDGMSITGTDVEGLRSVLSLVAGQVELGVIASNAAAGMVYEQFATVNLGRFSIHGQLVPPPSNTALSVDTVPIKLNVLGTNIELETQSDAGGTFSFTSLPFGSVNLIGETEDLGVIYSGAGIVFMDADKDVTINLLTTIDVKNGVPEIVVGNAAF